MCYVPDIHVHSLMKQEILLNVEQVFLDAFPLVFAKFVTQ